MPLDRQKNHLLFLDSIRALAAIYVTIHHAVIQYYDFSMEDLTNFKRLSIKFFQYGHYAVDLFIVLSGFSLMLSVIKNGYHIKGGTSLFLKRRIIRIIPTYYFALAISLIMIELLIGEETGTHWDISIPIDNWDIATHILLIHDYFSSSVNTINHALWSISVEFRIYLFFPFLVWVWRKYGSLCTLFVSVFISINGTLILAYLRNFNSDLNVEGAGVSPFIILFTLGMLAANLSYSNNKPATQFRNFYVRFSRGYKLLGIIAVLAVMVSGKTFLKAILTSEMIFLQLIDVMVGTLTAIFLFICSVGNINGISSWRRLLNFRPLVFIGTFSYSLYLIHAPLLQMISQYVITPVVKDKFTATCLLVIVGLPIILVLAFWFYYLFERPFIVGKKSSFLKERSIP